MHLSDGHMIALLLQCYCATVPQCYCAAVPLLCSAIVKYCQYSMFINFLAAPVHL